MREEDAVFSIFPLPQLPLATLSLEFTPLGDTVFPDYSGAAWRGRFGACLRELVCITGAMHCNGCGYLHNCQYSYLFATVPPKDAARMRKYNYVPHPLVLAPPPQAGSKVYPAGSVFPLVVQVFGRACESTPLILHALFLTGEGGLRHGMQPLRLTGVRTAQLILDQPGVITPDMPMTVKPATPVTPACPCHPIEIELITPTRISKRGKIVRPKGLDFRSFFSTLLRRISMLTAFHTDTPLQTDFSGLVKSAESLEIIARDLQWREWGRHSARQKKFIRMGGLVGTFSIDLSNASELWPYLWLGQWTHLGKGTIMGLGRYEIRNLE